VDPEVAKKSAKEKQDASRAMYRESERLLRVTP
jgi:hypothetical protein